MSRSLLAPKWKLEQLGTSVNRAELVAGAADSARLCSHKTDERNPYEIQGQLDVESLSQYLSGKDSTTLATAGLPFAWSGISNAEPGNQ